ncbi:hypothetical protein [Parasitella parasitica]|uniref:Reverse transcriptase domain-containing protein n=1 Tax=Parasitella parasitica TaxID=35722 RepID=A0A0B7MYS1_9FUNG|nr:hypothetical protein [Parasitella parasitica]
MQSAASNFYGKLHYPGPMVPDSIKSFHHYGSTEWNFSYEAPAAKVAAKVFNDAFLSVDSKHRSHLSTPFQYCIRRFPSFYIKSPQFHGFDLSSEAPPPPSTFFPSPLSVKILAYADDTSVYLSNSQNFMLLQQAINIYMQACNALLNYHKTVATPLSGKPSASRSALLTANGIHAWHDPTSATPLIYLGYPICSNITQRNVAYQKLYDSI